MIGYPLDSHVSYKADGTPILDRAISSAPLRELYKKLFSDGVLPNPSTNLQVTVGQGMQVKVFAGFALCNGCMKLQETDAWVNLDASNAVNDRIDTIVLRLDDNDAVRSCELHVLTGIPAETPTAPALTRSGSIWELGLANVLIKANSTQISNANITDTRYDSNRCGIISSISEFDTTTLYQQIQADLEEFQEVNQAEFEAWFANIQNQLDGDVAANLQNQIGTLSELTTTDKDNLVEAINEVAGKEVDVLDSYEEIMANTTSGKVAGAVGVKEGFTELNNSLGGVSQFIVDETTGKISGYKTEIGGADTVFPFKGGVYDNLLDSFWAGNLNTLNASYTATEDTEIFLEILIIAGGTSSSATKANANVEITPTTAISETYDEIVDAKSGAWQKYAIKRYKLKVSAGDVVNIKATQTSGYTYTSVTALLWN